MALLWRMDAFGRARAGLRSANKRCLAPGEMNVVPQEQYQTSSRLSCANHSQQRKGKERLEKRTASCCITTTTVERLWEFGRPLLAAAGRRRGLRGVDGVGKGKLERTPRCQDPFLFSLCNVPSPTESFHDPASVIEGLSQTIIAMTPCHQFPHERQPRIHAPALTECRCTGQKSR
jgi:hypothetical protein